MVQAPDSSPKYRPVTNPQSTNPLYPPEKQFPIPKGTTFLFRYDSDGEKQTGNYEIISVGQKSGLLGFYDVVLNPRTGEIKIYDNEHLKNGQQNEVLKGYTPSPVILPGGGESIVQCPEYDYPRKTMTLKPGSKDYGKWLSFIRTVEGDKKLHFRSLDEINKQNLPENKELYRQEYTDQKRITGILEKFKPPKR